MMGGSFGTTIFGFVAISVIIGIARMYIWTRITSGGSARKIARIADSDAHLSFDERIAERMREMEREKALNEPLARAPMAQAESPVVPSLGASPLATAPRPTFGRRAG